MIISSFYDVAFLLEKGHDIAQIDKEENGKKRYHFVGEDELIQKDLEEFRNDKVLQEYIHSIVKLRNINKVYYGTWDNRNSTDNKKTVSSVEV